MVSWMWAVPYCAAHLQTRFFIVVTSGEKLQTYFHYRLTYCAVAVRKMPGHNSVILQIHFCTMGKSNKHHISMINWRRYQICWSVKKNLAQHLFLDYTCFFFSFVPALHHHLPPQLRRGCFFVSAVLVPCAPLLFPEWFLWSRLLVHGLSVSDASERQTESASKSFCDCAAFPLFLPVPVQQRGGALAFSPRQQTMPSVFFVAAQRQHNCPPLHLLTNKKAYTQVHSHWNSSQTPQIFPQFKESKKRLSVLIQGFENKVLHCPEPSS